LIQNRVGRTHPIRTLTPNSGGTSRTTLQGDAMADLDRTVWTAPVRNLTWVAAHFGHR
jgi:hypothetical protein